MNPPASPPAPARVLVKLRPSSALRAAEGRARLRPLFHGEAAAQRAFALQGEPQWFLAELEGGGDTPWDLAHDRIAQRLGVAESDVVFAEPDLVHDIYPDPLSEPPEGPRPAVEDCEVRPQNQKGGQAKGPSDDGWHLENAYSQLKRAREAVTFSDPRTRIAHLDTGYDPRHVSMPAHILRHLERSFVDGDPDPGSAADPDRKVFLLDNSGHGTGTLSILAGGAVPAWGGRVMGGAPDAEILPLRIADRVVLLRTSAFAAALQYAVEQGCDVVSMSMGGLPSRAWRETVDRAYLAGVCMVTAAGNNYNGLPTRHLVYPARYGRVIAAAGVMANGHPYAGLQGLKTMEGNYGPEKKMASALAAFTPNIPWARYGCPDAVRLDGAGTSAATPQIAAAAALWLERNKHALPRDWRRVEAVRYALFESAKRKAKKNRETFGNGVLQAYAALEVAPMLGLPQTKADKDSFALFRVLTGLGFAEALPREQMFNLELSQRWLLVEELQELFPDPEVAERFEELDRKALLKAMEVLIADPAVSRPLRHHLEQKYVMLSKKRPPKGVGRDSLAASPPPACDAEPTVANPPYRRLRVYSGDPSLSATLATVQSNEVTLSIPWEELRKGPVGEYLEVDDLDAAGRRYDGVNLNDPRLLATDGWAPSAGNPQFHQQMAFAVAMKTITHFERALGRPVLWRPRENPADRHDDSGYVQRLVIRPHALHEANAYYSPAEVALKFGYFQASHDAPDVEVPGTRIYTCLSHDIVAHETTHAVLDGMHRTFNQPTNPDVLALHEAFADIVALMQHFTIREVLEREIGRTRGDLEAESSLGSLAVQFGHSIGRSGALRNAIGRMENGRWRRTEPDPSLFRTELAPHTRGAILVAAVFDAFLAIYRTRTADLLRLYTGGTGVLPAGAIHPDLVGRLAAEASKSAEHVLTMCIRALDYVPPVDVTFFEYLRGLITADYDLVRDDHYNYRVAFVEAFRRRGIHPDVMGRANTPRTLSVETLRWQSVHLSRFAGSERQEVQAKYNAIVDELRDFAHECTYTTNRETLFHQSRTRRRSLHKKLADAFKETPSFATALGIDVGRAFEVHALRQSLRQDPGGRTVPQVIVALLQEKAVAADPESGTPAYAFRGGSTLVVDLTEAEVKYCIGKSLGSTGRKKRTDAYLRETAADPLRAALMGADNLEPFAVLHALAE